MPRNLLKPIVRALLQRRAQLVQQPGFCGATLVALSNHISLALTYENPRSAFLAERFAPFTVEPVQTDGTSGRSPLASQRNQHIAFKLRFFSELSGLHVSYSIPTTADQYLYRCFTIVERIDRLAM